MQMTHIFAEADAVPALAGIWYTASEPQIRKKEKGFMKRLIILLMMLFPLLAAAEEAACSDPDDFDAVLRPDGTLMIIRYTGEEAEVRIPPRKDGYTITAIGDYAFACRDIRTVRIPDEVTEVGRNPFVECGVREIQVSSGHPTLEVVDGILYSRPDRRLICYPSGLSGEEFLRRCGRAGEAYEIPAGTEIIGSYAFFGVHYKPDWILPDTVAVIEDSAFWETFSAVFVPESVTEIHEDNFGMGNDGVYVECMPGSAAERFLLSNGHARFDLADLLYPVLPFDEADAGQTEQDERFRYPLKRCGDFRYFLLRDGTAALYDYAGEKETLTLPETVDGWPVSSLITCSSGRLKKVTIPDGIFRVSSINPFSGCPNLEEIQVSPGHPGLSLEQGVLLSRGTVVACPRKRPGDTLVLPEGIREIGGEAFLRCETLKSVTLPEGVRAIRRFAFAECAALRTVCLPGTVTEFGLGIFNGDEILDLSIPYSLENAWLFDNDYAFSDDEPDFSYPVFSDPTETYSYACLKDGTACILSYAGEETDVVVPESLDGHPVSTVGISAFQGMKIKTLTLPEGIRVIGDSAFEGCDLLRSVTLPESLAVIGDCAFRDCVLLESIPLPSGLAAIGEGAFAGCRNLDSVLLPEKLETLGGGAFENCSRLQSVRIPEGLQTLGMGIFSGCTGLRTAEMPGRRFHLFMYWYTSGGPSPAAYDNLFEGCENVTVYGPRYSGIECCCRTYGIAFVPTD